VANLETGLLRPLIVGFRAAVRADGWLVLSGILDHECAEVRALTEQHGFICQATDADGEWRSLLFQSAG
jgi:ribosomal protein L11 methylase PrmA